MIGLAPYRAPQNLFLLNPKNEAFLKGDSPKLDSLPFIGGYFLYGCMALFLIIPIVIAIFAVLEIQIRGELDQHGVVTSATVTNRRISTSTNSKGQRSTSYYITYEFYAGTSNNDNPMPYTYEQAVSSGTYNSVVEGSKIDIRYLPNDPNTSRVLNDSANDPRLILIFCAIFMIAPLVFIYSIRRASSRNKRLAVEGQLLTGRITEAKLRRAKSNYQLSVRYSFMSPEGMELGKQELRVRNDLKDGGIPEPGTPVTVIYMNPKLYRVL